MTHRGTIDHKFDMCYTSIQEVQSMDDFVITKDQSGGVIPSMTAENQEYKLHWFYDGNYIEEKKAGTLRREGIVVQIMPKDDKNLHITYVPVDEEAVIQVQKMAILTSDVEALIKALDIAKEAAEKAVSFMRPYI
jgi:hypothetical protein